ncbi:4-hydroxybenzoate polyprenyltransferase [Ruminiclostridium sufflavum DSM 19573]|uniref:4-hydroxybenzoate polyprenyltransferase n=1 Tax=Ruminiclostridium sufflavum DSM 19573 TaxID=1121337 RepID=A0A318XMI4_9FIRM|nr:decaprenyl-phosphate phosphoribosyltransferase [Ruminiclostridium sufflavum]PYG87854.1 4-hydroxybenzoate polyprenyltransferase [Ruminiclostridium sufflavum DSM 19573]
MYNKFDYPELLISERKATNINSMVRLFRPKQWIKNIFVFLALLFSGNIIELSHVVNSCIGLILFCLISSSVYILNDLLDINADRIHPIKKFRPLASGAVSKVQALVLLIILCPISLVLSFWFNYNFAAVISVYFILNVLYTIKLKKIVIVDIMVISTGFVLRVISGYIVINEEISLWILLCIFFLTMFLGLNKRKQEIHTLNSNAKEHRKILNEYSVELINQILPIVASCSIIFYSFYTFQVSKNIWMVLTIPSVIYGMLRYQYLSLKSNVGENPEIVLVNDIPFIVNFVLLVFIAITIKFIKALPFAFS